MKLKSKIVASTVLAAIFAAVSSVSAATQMNLSLVYLGYTTANASAATRVAGANVLLNTTSAPGGDLTTISNSFTKTALTDPSIQGTTNLKAYFAVYLDYVPNLPTDSLYGVGFNVLMPAGMAPVTGNNVADSSTNKILLFNPVDGNTGVGTWDTAGDFGPAGGDLVDIGIFQSTAASAYAMKIGQPAAIDNFDEAGYISGKGTLLGVFALKFTQTGVTGDVSIVGTPGNTVWFFDNADSAQANSDAAFHLATAPIKVGDVPEPASLGVLALGGLALLARRRK